ncbi:hypothetical protein OAA91_02105 [Fibrobacterales bacterium]|nr:hypothetical protein [Fibrobacterales bacterium]
MKNVKYILITFFAMAFLLLPMGFDYVKKNKSEQVNKPKKTNVAGGTIAGNGLELSKIESLASNISDSLAYSQNQQTKKTIQDLQPKSLELIIHSKDSTPIDSKRQFDCKEQNILSNDSKEIIGYCENFIIDNIESLFENNLHLEKITFSKPSRLILSNQSNIIAYDASQVEKVVKLQEITSDKKKLYSSILLKSNCWINKLPSWKFIYTTNTNLDVLDSKAWLLKQKENQYIIGCF